ncbi:MAG: hypothetical protein AB7T49_14305 [Oligoflexales bacterium]
MNKRSFALFTLLTLTSCKSASTNQNIMSDTATSEAITGTAASGMPFSQDEKIKCPEGQELLTTSLKRVANVQPSELGFNGDVVIEPQDIKLDRIVGDGNIYTANYAVRFDFCFDNAEALSLQRIIVQKKSVYAFGGQRPVFHVLSVTNPKASPAFAKALFEQDYTGIEARFPSTYPEFPSYYVKGHRTPLGQNFLTINSYKMGDNPYVFFGEADDGKPTLTAAELEAANPFEAFDKPIEAKWEIASHDLKEGTLEFKFSYEVRFHGAGYRSYQYDQRAVLIIEDANPKLKQKVSIKIEKQPVEDFLEYVKSHHNRSDTFIFSDPAGQVKYTLRPAADERGKLIVEYREDLGIPKAEYIIMRTLKPVPSHPQPM